MNRVQFCFKRVRLYLLIMTYFLILSLPSSLACFFECVPIFRNIHYYIEESLQSRELTLEALILRPFWLVSDQRGLFHFCIKDRALIDEYFNEISSRPYNAWDQFSSEVITARSIFPIRQVGGIDGGLA